MNADRRPRLSLVRTWPVTGRPLTRLHATVQRWRNQFADPLWIVRPQWIRNLQAEHGCDVRLLLPERDALRDDDRAPLDDLDDQDDQTAWLEVDADLSDVAAEQVLNRALAELHVEELARQCASLREGRRRAAPAPAGARHQVA
jgi:hypothetical protein